MRLELVLSLLPALIAIRVEGEELKGDKLVAELTDLANAIAVATASEFFGVKSKSDFNKIQFFMNKLSDECVARTVAEMAMTKAEESSK